jgi:hypothetical protein
MNEIEKKETRGRKEITPGERAVAISATVTKAQADKLRAMANGNISAALRQILDKEFAP